MNLDPLPLFPGGLEVAFQFELLNLGERVGRKVKDTPFQRRVFANGGICQREKLAKLYAVTGHSRLGVAADQVEVMEPTYASRRMPRLPSSDVSS